LVGRLLWRRTAHQQRTMLMEASPPASEGTL
jgi:hypothetical protein